MVSEGEIVEPLLCESRDSRGSTGQTPKKEGLMQKTEVIAALIRLRDTYKNAAKKRMKEQKIQEAVRMNWKKDAIEHAIQLIELLDK